ncbi:PREDICTED: ketimine reductase mu-crystallin [Nicrophorus vespilloides]|uniref:Ketimine reductase mu-crystallin n=1 Tax=Nicrophorus vespilloides TaxID=110193 RepID=A0ABM1N5P7_NICVS|nr:PREDICTED: ketimine reductase mu-crystallin [Nicrophorus vespilloides]
MNVVFVDENRVESLLDWDSTLAAVEASMSRVSQGRVFQNPRTYTTVEKTQTMLLTMPGHLEDSKFGALACKLVTVADGNEKLPKPMANILANIAMFDETTGALKAIVAATAITTWRTAAASAVATKYLHDGKQKTVLAILGAGVQGKSHALAFQHFFNFSEVRIWNHSVNKAKKLADDLNSELKMDVFKYASSAQECVENADVIVTATSAPSPILKRDWLKDGVHINAVGASTGCHYCELDEDIYKDANIYVDYWSGANTELAGLLDKGFKFECEVGDLVNGKTRNPHPSKVTIFQSLGMAVEDCAMARMIYDKHCKN